MLPRSFASIARYCLHCFSLRLAFICSYLSSLESVSMPPSFALFSLMLQVVFGRALSNSGMGTIVDVLHVPQERRGMESIGTVHHVAWRTANDEHQLEWRRRLL